MEKNLLQQYVKTEQRGVIWRSMVKSWHSRLSLFFFFLVFFYFFFSSPNNNFITKNETIICVTGGILRLKWQQWNLWLGTWTCSWSSCRFCWAKFSTAGTPCHLLGRVIFLPQTSKPWMTLEAGGILPVHVKMLLRVCWWYLTCCFYQDILGSGCSRWLLQVSVNRGECTEQPCWCCSLWMTLLLKLLGHVCWLEGVNACFIFSEQLCLLLSVGFTVINIWYIVQMLTLVALHLL